jgi:23S rRNA (uracil1939-C5)-methyltransferase
LLLNLEKMIYGGDGLARLPANEPPSERHGRGKAVFVPFVLEGETIEAHIIEQKPGFARASVDSIVKSSPHRVEPACPYFTRCGGCHYQHASYEHQLEIKKEILRETLRRTAKLELTCGIEVHASPPWNYRNRSRLQIRTSPDFKLGYFKSASLEVIPVEHCPISSPLINRAISAMWQIGRAGKIPEGVQEIELFADASDFHLLAELGCSAEARRASIRSLADDLLREVPEIAGIVAFREQRPSPDTPQEKLVSIGDPYITCRTHRAEYRVSVGSFFQTNRYLIDEMVKIVTEGQSGDLALDLYAGVGLFSTVLASDFRHIVSVESSQRSTGDLSYNLPSNGEAIRATTEQYLARLKKSEWVRAGKVLPQSFPAPDLAVVDPPRSGLGEPVARLLASLGAPQIVYVSCDPATLARDLGPLVAAGYRVTHAHLLDLFPQTYHIESIVELKR